VSKPYAALVCAGWRRPHPRLWRNWSKPTSEIIDSRSNGEFGDLVLPLLYFP